MQSHSVTDVKEQVNNFKIIVTEKDQSIPTNQLNNLILQYN